MAKTVKPSSKPNPFAKKGTSKDMPMKGKMPMGMHGKGMVPPPAKKPAGVKAK